MSKAASAPRRVSKAKTKGYTPDRIVGGLMMLFDLFGIVAGGFVAATGGKPVEKGWPGEFAGSAIIVFFVACLFVDLGVLRGRRWAFFGLVLVSIFELSSHSLHLDPKLLLVPGLWTLVYAVLRLIPAFGPKLR